MKNFLFVLLFAFTSMLSFSQGVEGMWKIVNPKTGNTESHVQMYIEDGKLYGKIFEIFGEGKTAICTNCTGENKGKPLEGLVIIEGLERDGKYWYKKKGVLFPETGNYYDVKVWAEGDKLKIRGYWGVLYKTHSWDRVDDV